MEKIQLAIQLEGAREEHKELMKQIDDMNSQTRTHGEETRKQCSCDDDCTMESSSEPLRRKSIAELEGKSDAMEIPRMKRRLAQTENELKRTRTKLLSAQSTLKVYTPYTSINMASRVVWYKVVVKL